MLGVSPWEKTPPTSGDGNSGGVKGDLNDEAGFADSDKQLQEYDAGLLEDDGPDYQNGEEPVGTRSGKQRRKKLQVTKVIAQEGGTASLDCEVDAVGEGMVSYSCLSSCLHCLALRSYGTSGSCVCNRVVHPRQCR